jgi:hypothetical protein
LKERQEQDKKVEDEGKVVLEDAPRPSIAPPIMGSIDGAKRRRNHTISYRELACRRGQEIELAALEFYNIMSKFGIGPRCLETTYQCQTRQSLARATQEGADEDDLSAPHRATSPTLGRGKRKKMETTRFLEGVESGWIQVKKGKVKAC